jgi:hypothetical protein
MRVIKGKEGCQHSWQDEFPETISCACGGTAHVAFVAIEESGEEDGYICDDMPEGAKLWPHDAIAVAVYICKSCMKSKSLMNQG